MESTAEEYRSPTTRHATVWSNLEYRSNIDDVHAIPDADLAADLSGAAERGELLTNYQPQLDLASGRVVAVEALVRWDHPRHGVIAPNTFIPVAEWAGNIREVGGFVLAESTRQLAQWRDAGLALEMSVNVSPTELEGDLFCGGVLNSLARWILDPSLLTIEITETEPIVDLPHAVECLDELRGHGVGVSIDDFGTGHSSVDQLHNLPTTEFKIDQSLIRGTRRAARRVLRAVIQEAKQTGIRIVAEGVETAEQLDHAVALGCDRAQGYLIGRPMPAAALAASLR